MLDTMLNLTARRTDNGTVVSATLFDGTECLVGESTALGKKRAMMELARRNDIQSVLRRLEHRDSNLRVKWAERETAKLVKEAAEMGIAL